MSSIMQETDMRSTTFTGGILVNGGTLFITDFISRGAGHVAFAPLSPIWKSRTVVPTATPSATAGEARIPLSLLRRTPGRRLAAD